MPILTKSTNFIYSFVIPFLLFSMQTALNEENVMMHILIEISMQNAVDVRSMS